MKIIYGSGNQEKLAEVKSFFKNNNIPCEVLSLQDIGFADDIIEDGETFEENSLIKAKTVKKYCDINNIKETIITDDAGLCVDALNGRPGVYSARYAGNHASQEITINKLLTEMKDVPEKDRTAKFVCVLTCILKNGKIITARGETKGHIANKPGTMGRLTFGPVFIADEFGRIMNDLTNEELKHTHREKALINLLEILKGES